MREEDAVYVVVVRFRLKRAEEKEDQGRGRREWSVFGGKSSPPLLLLFNGRRRSSVWEKSETAGEEEGGWKRKSSEEVPRRAGTTYLPASTCVVAAWSQRACAG